MVEALPTSTTGKRQCHALTEAGTSCRRRPLIGGRFCYVHDPAWEPTPRRERSGLEPLVNAQEAARRDSGAAGQG